MTKGWMFILDTLIVTGAGDPQTSNAPVNIPGMPLELGASVTSVIDTDIKPDEIFAVALEAGQSLQFDLQGSDMMELWVLNPGSSSTADAQGPQLCNYHKLCSPTFNAAVAGTYYVDVRARAQAIRYTLIVTKQ
jgi:hypothetical protein